MEKSRADPICTVSASQSFHIAYSSVEVFPVSGFI